MVIDIEGKVNNINLAKDKALLPLFEAIVNSIQSINALDNKKDTFINITLNRDYSQIVDKENENIAEFYPIKNIIIEDNGVGFTEENYSSFSKSDSTYKKAIGGKGVGRFLWLKAFDNAIVDSTYNNEDKIYNRKFTFSMDREVIRDNENIEISEGKRSTKIELVNFKEPFRKACTKKLEIIALKIIEHCISFFILENCPTITLEDGFKKINLNNIFESTIKVNTDISKFMIKENEFEIAHVKLYSWHENKNLLHFSANKREVCCKNIEKKIANLKNKIKIDGEDAFIYSVYITGKLLDDNVNSERTGFNLTNSNEDNFGC